MDQETLNLTLSYWRQLGTPGLIEFSELECQLCYYANPTAHIQVIRLSLGSNQLHPHFERILFSGQRCLFEAPVDAVLQIYSGVASPDSATYGKLLSQIPCSTLVVKEPSAAARNGLQT